MGKGSRCSVRYRDIDGDDDVGKAELPFSESRGFQQLLLVRMFTVGGGLSSLSFLLLFLFLSTTVIIISNPRAHKTPISSPPLPFFPSLPPSLLPSIHHSSPKTCQKGERSRSTSHLALIHSRCGQMQDAQTQLT